MTWTVPIYKKSQVDWAGAILIDPNAPSEVIEEALQIINNWRSSHSFPLNTFQNGLRRRANNVDPKYLAAQRIKRLSSIESKLQRFKTMHLSQMQDIGGCRAIVRTMSNVNSLVDLYKKCRIKHKLDHIDDYIKNPKESGYRGIHLIYRYHSDKNETYNGLKIEIQLRTPLQHAWATAVETVGTFIKQALKSSMGEKEWLRFFALMGSAIAGREKTPLIPNTPTNKEDLINELRQYTHELKVENRLNMYGATLNILEDPSAENAQYFLLELDPGAQQVKVFGFKAQELDQASKKYLTVERDIADRPGAEAVLVSVESLALLRRAYPNYFLDTTVFIAALNHALES